MDPSSTSRNFGVWDYVIFATMLLLSAGIGVFSALSGGRQRTAEEFFLGDRKMSILPVAMSVVVSHVSAISVIGTPGEIYMYDSMYAWSLLAHAIPNLLSIRLFIPIFFRLRITSTCEYLEMRFNRTVRTVCTVIFSIQTIIYMGIAMYTPALAINAVTGMDLWTCVLSTGLICIFYTTVGGMKAVLWADTLQAVIILLGVAAVIVKGTMEVGGLGAVWRIGHEGGRIKFDEFSADPRIRYSVWSLMVGMGTMNVGIGFNQTIMQRLFSCGSKRKAIRALVLATLIKFITFGLCIFSGIVMYVYYVDCDPYTHGVVRSKDQIMPLMVMDLFGNMPGLPGLFLSAVVGASISTLSSGVNSLAALSGEDGVKVIWPKISAQKYTRVVKLLALMYGLLSIAAAFIASQLGQGVLQLCLSIIGLTSGSTIGVFILGIYMHRSNSKGVIAGMVTSTLFIGWIKIGSILYPASGRGKNSLSVEGCQVYNMSTTEEGTWLGTTPSTLYTDVPSVTEDEMVSNPAIADFYGISYLYYSPIGLFICLTVAMIVSRITGFTDPDNIDPRLKSNLTDAFFCCFPESLKRMMRCGVDKVKINDEDDDDDVNDMKYFDGLSENMEKDHSEEEKTMLSESAPDDQAVV